MIEYQIQEKIHEDFKISQYVLYILVNRNKNATYVMIYYIFVEC